MNYTAGYTATFYATIMDGWTEKNRLDLISGSITNTAEGLRQSASLEVRDFDKNAEHWLRIYMDARQDQNVTHTPIFTGVASAPKQQQEGPVETNELACYSVLEPADTQMTIGDYIPLGMNAGEAIKRLLQQTPAPVVIDDGIPALDNYIVAEDNETNITMTEKILQAIGWQLIIEGDGTIRVRKTPTEAAAKFGPDYDVIEQQISRTRDWFKIPNVLIATSGDAVAVAKDEDPASPLSIPSRGREITKTVREAKTGGNEGLAEYARRTLQEEQQIAEELEYTRRFVPALYVGDIIQMDYDNLQGFYKITNQTINLTYNGQTSEKVEK